MLQVRAIRNASATAAAPSECGESFPAIEQSQPRIPAVLPSGTGMNLSVCAAEAPQINCACFGLPIDARQAGCVPYRTYRREEK